MGLLFMMNQLKHLHGRSRARKNSGSALIIVVFVLMFISSMGVIAMDELSKRHFRSKIVAISTHVESVLFAYNDYYLAECRSNGGVFSAPTIDDLINQGYLSKKLSLQYSFSISSSFGHAQLTATFGLDSEELAKRVITRFNTFDSSRSGGEISFNYPPELWGNEDVLLEHRISGYKPCP